MFLAVRILRLLAGLLMLPLCAAVTLALADTLRSLPSSPSLIAPQSAALAGGYAVWLLIYLFLPSPMRAYIWAHELTHALWGLLFGARIHAFRVKKTGGAVSLSKSNTLIALAPYFFPLYTMIVIVVRLVLSIWVPMASWELLWLFLVGFTWGFHFTFTVHTLTVRQPDIVENGRVFSLTLLYLLNILGIGLWVVCTTPATLQDFGWHVADRVGDAYIWTWEQIAWLATWVAGLF